ncbi:uncharacterized protein LOC114195125 [Vigna unguiculata]|uniref:uncharacterized protein LOC114195125 n=1 Tax=Vigna unguiculata TaxID=3917 RepID=UPI0010166856|nr:uncharacterized protein LOC114195125 [Vigna unguiculata]
MRFDLPQSGSICPDLLRSSPIFLYRLRRWRCGGKELYMESQEKNSVGFFQMPLHYPRYTQKDYEDMPEWKLDSLLKEYGLPTNGDLAYKRDFAMGAFLWPNSLLLHNNVLTKTYHK